MAHFVLECFVTEKIRDGTFRNRMFCRCTRYSSVDICYFVLAPRKHKVKTILMCIVSSNLAIYKLKGVYHRIFDLQLFASNNSSWYHWIIGYHFVNFDSF